MGDKMKSEKSLIKVNNNIFLKFFKSIKSLFLKNRNKKTEEIEEVQGISKDQENTPLDDFEILKDVINGKIEIKDLDINLERRLIVLCNNRIKEINKKIIAKDFEIAKLKKQISN